MVINEPCITFLKKLLIYWVGVRYVLSRFLGSVHQFYSLDLLQFSWNYLPLEDKSFIICVKACGIYV